MHDKGYARPNGRWKLEVDFELMLDILNSVRNGSVGRHCDVSHLKRRIGYSFALVYFIAVFFGGWVAWWKCRFREGTYLPKSLIVCLVMSAAGVVVYRLWPLI